MLRKLCCWCFEDSTQDDIAEPLIGASGATAAETPADQRDVVTSNDVVEEVPKQLVVPQSAPSPSKSPPPGAAQNTADFPISSVSPKSEKAAVANGDVAVQDHGAADDAQSQDVTKQAPVPELRHAIESPSEAAKEQPAALVSLVVESVPATSTSPPVAPKVAVKLESTPVSNAPMEEGVNIPQSETPTPPTPKLETSATAPVLPAASQPDKLEVVENVSASAPVSAVPATSPKAEKPLTVEAEPSQKPEPASKPAVAAKPASPPVPAEAKPVSPRAPAVPPKAVSPPLPQSSAHASEASQKSLSSVELDVGESASTSTAPSPPPQDSHEDKTAAAGAASDAQKKKKKKKNAAKKSKK